MRTPQEISADNLFWSNIDIIQKTLGTNNELLAKELGVHEKKFSFYKKNRLSIPYTNVKRFSNKLGINAESILQAKLKAPQLESALKLSWVSQMPEKYLVGLGSKSFTVRHILKVAEKYGLKEETCKHFGINQFSFDTSINFSVSVQLASDVLQYIASRVSLQNEDYSSIAYSNSFYLKDSIFGQRLSEAKNLEELYEIFLKVVNELEENWTYEIQYADKNKIILNSYPSENLSEVYKRRDYSSYTFTKFRSYVGSYITRYVGLEGAEPTVTKSIHHGDSHCQFNICFTRLKPISA